MAQEGEQQKVFEGIAYTSLDVDVIPAFAPIPLEAPKSAEPNTYIEVPAHVILYSVLSEDQLQAIGDETLVLYANEHSEFEIYLENGFNDRFPGVLEQIHGFTLGPNNEPIAVPEFLPLDIQIHGSENLGLQAGEAIYISPPNAKDGQEIILFMGENNQVSTMVDGLAYVSDPRAFDRYPIINVSLDAEQNIAMEFLPNADAEAIKQPGSTAAPSRSALDEALQTERCQAIIAERQPEVDAATKLLFSSQAIMADYFARPPKNQHYESNLNYWIAPRVGGGGASSSSTSYYGPGALPGTERYERERADYAARWQKTREKWDRMAHGNLAELSLSEREELVKAARTIWKRTRRDDHTPEQIAIRTAHEENARAFLEIIGEGGTKPRPKKDINHATNAYTGTAWRSLKGSVQYHWEKPDEALLSDLHGVQKGVFMGGAAVAMLGEEIGLGLVKGVNFLSPWDIPTWNVDTMGAADRFTSSPGFSNGARMTYYTSGWRMAGMKAGWAPGTSIYNSKMGIINEVEATQCAPLSDAQKVGYFAGYATGETLFFVATGGAIGAARAPVVVGARISKAVERAAAAGRSEAYQNTLRTRMMAQASNPRMEGFIKGSQEMFTFSRHGGARGSGYIGPVGRTIYRTIGYGGIALPFYMEWKKYDREVAGDLAISSDAPSIDEIMEQINDVTAASEAEETSFPIEGHDEDRPLTSQENFNGVSGPATPENESGINGLFGKISSGEEQVVQETSLSVPEDKPEATKTGINALFGELTGTQGDKQLETPESSQSTGDTHKPPVESLPKQH